MSELLHSNVDIAPRHPRMPTWARPCSISCAPPTTMYRQVCGGWHASSMHVTRCTVDAVRGPLEADILAAVEACWDHEERQAQVQGRLCVVILII